MRKLLLFLGLFVFWVNIVHAGVLLSDSGVVTYPAGRGYSSRSIVKKYNFSLKEDSKVTLHFITHVDRYVGIKLMETDTEKPIKPLTDRISIADNPFTRSVNLRAGQYTFIVYKERSGGNVDNTGTYKFTFTKESRVEQHEVLPQQPIVITDVDPEKQSDVNNGRINDKDTHPKEESDNAFEVLNDVLGFVSSLKTILTGKYSILGFIASIIMFLIKRFR